eukprot:jgi/Chlat1/8070/Chrsp73S07538
MASFALLLPCPALSMRRRRPAVAPGRAATVRPAWRSAPRPQRKHKSHPATSAALGGVPVPAITSAAEIAAAGAVVVTLGFRAYVYLRMQYVTAAMLGRHVPKEATVVELGMKGGRNLYYYPKSTRMVIGVSPSAKAGLLQQTAATIGMPLDVRQQPLAPLDIATSSVDAVVSVNALSGVADPAACIAEAARVLRPGKPFIFLEETAANGGLAAALQGLFGKKADIATVECGGFGDVHFDVLFEGQAPRAVGVATKQVAAGSPVGSTPAKKTKSRK